MKKPQGLSEALNRRTNNILQNTTQKTKYRATQTLLKLRLKSSMQLNYIFDCQIKH